MLYLKKYFTEGLIQMAILLSLCGVRVDLGLEPYLLPSWHEMMPGPTSALSPTQFHNLRNRLEDGHGLHPKSVDLDGFFTARRLLGLVHSLDRLQVPRAELETWLVQREPDPLPVGFLDQSTPLTRAPAGLERDNIDPSMEARAALILQDEDGEEEEKEEGARHELHNGGERGDEEEEEETEELPSIHRQRREGGGRPGDPCGLANRELTQNEIDQTSFSLQECLRLLEETFPFTEQQQMHDVGDREGDPERLSSERDPMLSPIIPRGNLDMELHWQDVLAIMGPENANADMMTVQDVRPEDLLQNRIDNDSDVKEPDQEVPRLETPWLHDFSAPLTQSEMESAAFALTPSAELDDHSSALNTRATLRSSNVNPLYGPPDHRDLLAEDTSEDFSMGLNAEDDISSLNMNLLPNNFVESMEGSPYPEYGPHPETPSSFDVGFHSGDSRPTSLPPFPEGNGNTQDFLSSPSSIFDDEDVEDEDGLPSPLNELLEDAAILDEISLLDLALEEGFSAEMAARLEEEGYLGSEIAQQDDGMGRDQSGSSMAETEDQRLPRPQQQDGEHEADSDSGLSLDFSHSPASPSESEASSYSSSSSSSSSCVSAEESLLSEDEDEDSEEWLAGAHMDVEVTIKEEELEEELGAVGGGYPNYVKTSLSPNHSSDKMFNGFPWLEHIGHDHTYNQPCYPASSPSSGKMPTKQSKSSQRHNAAKPYHHSSSRHISETKMWSRDERRAKALKVPFSNQLIVNLPVEEFNDLLANFQLTEEQLALIRDIRRRGKNKIAAQNCRKRKMDVLLGLGDSVSGLRVYRSRLLREKQEALRKLQEMKHRLSVLYQEVFSRLRDEEGRPLNAMEYQLNFEANGSVTVASRQQGAVLSMTKNSKKHREKKK